MTAECVRNVLVCSERGWTKQLMALRLAHMTSKSLGLALVSEGGLMYARAHLLASIAWRTPYRECMLALFDSCRARTACLVAASTDFSQRRLTKFLGPARTNHDLMCTQDTQLLLCRLLYQLYVL